MSDRAINVAVVKDTQDAPTSPGDVLAGKYEVERVLGKGAMGVVVSAMHQRLRERVALKFLLPSVSRNEELNARFQREARVTAKLRSEHVARVTDVGVLDSGAPYMVMEYLEGEDLRKILKREGPFEVMRALDYIIQACEGVAEAHSLGVIHRDLKPSNLFLTQRRDGSDLVKVLDFGVSKASLATIDPGESELTSTGSVLGSPRYMSPEQLIDSQRVDGRADVWSIATILYELLSGRAPFQAESAASVCAKILNDDTVEPIRNIRPEVPDELEAALDRALQKNLDLRTQDVGVFAKELAACIDSPSSSQSADRAVAMLAGAGSAPSHSLPAPSQTNPTVRSASQSRSRARSGQSSNTGVAWAGTKGQWPRSRVIGVAAVVVALAALVAFFVHSSGSKPASSTEPAASAPVAPTTPVAKASATPAPAKSAAPVASASAAPPAASAAPPAASAETAKKGQKEKSGGHTTRHVVPHHYRHRHASKPHHTSGKSSSTAKPTAPKPTATSQSSVNILEERQ